MADLLFYCCADRRYEDFAPLFIASSLWSVETARAEIGLESVDRYVGENRRLMQIIEETYRDRVVLRDVAWTRNGVAIKPNTVRFVTQPETRASYVYICDIDLIFLDRRFPAGHLEFMEKVGLPYSNCTRPDTERLTGLHFTAWDAMYPLPDISDLNLRTTDDEVVLRLMCARKGLGFHDLWYRPVPGIHISPNRQPEPSVSASGAQIPGWHARPHLRAYAQFRQSDVFRAIAPLLKGKAREAIDIVEAMALPVKAPPAPPPPPAPVPPPAPSRVLDPERERRRERRKRRAARRVTGGEAPASK
jgi:hypothetical protein